MNYIPAWCLANIKACRQKLLDRNFEGKVRLGTGRFAQELEKDFPAMGNKKEVRKKRKKGSRGVCFLDQRLVNLAKFQGGNG